MGQYEVQSTGRTYDGVLSRVRVDRVTMPGGDVTEREVVEHDNAVGVVVVDEDRRVVLLRHYRHPVGKRLLEIPAGKLDVEGESPEDAARRELIEEVGLAAVSLTTLIHFHNSAGWTDEATTVYLTTDAVAQQAPDDFTAVHEEADLEVVRVPLDRAVQMVVSGAITDAKTVIGILLADRHLANDAAAAGA